MNKIEMDFLGFFCVCHVCVVYVYKLIQKEIKQISIVSWPSKLLICNFKCCKVLLGSKVLVWLT